MIFIIGPSGVGKTTLRRSVMQEMFCKPSLWGKGRTPAVETFAMLPNSAYFSAKALARSLLDELHAPTLDWLLSSGSLTPSESSQVRVELASSAAAWQMLKPKRGTEGDFWDMVKRGIAARGCKYISVDQATALLVNHRDTSPADHTLHLMALAESTGVMFLMTGVHSAARLWAVHSELRRRVITVWVPPYSDKRKEDLAQFSRLLATVGCKYTLAQSDLLQRMKYDILAATGGVFAELVQLLSRARDLAVAEGTSKIKKAHLEGAYYSDDDLRTLWRDIDAFEACMQAGSVGDRAQLARTRWGESSVAGAVE